MEKDSVRTSGDITLVEMWIGGRLRDVCVSRAAIETCLRLSPTAAAAMTDEDRREFVRTHLAEISAAAAVRLRELGPTAPALTIEAGQLAGGDRLGGDRPDRERRRGDRRKGERRIMNLGPPASGERRR
jgi:hypothetical protein